MIAAHQTMIGPQETWPVPLYTGVSLVGSSVQNNNGILSGFTSSSYATMPWRMTAGATSLEAVIYFTVQDAVQNMGIWGCVGTKNSFSPFYSANTASKNLSAFLSSNGTSWNISNPTATPYVNYANSTELRSYLLKMTFSNTVGYTQYRHDNGAWVLCGTIANTAAPYGKPSLVPHLGNNRGNGSPFYGTIDLNYTYLMRDGELWWEGVAGAYRNVKTTYPD